MNTKGETEAYILDEVNVKLYRVNADGVVLSGQCRNRKSDEEYQEYETLMNTTY